MVKNTQSWGEMLREKLLAAFGKSAAPPPPPEPEKPALPPEAQIKQTPLWKNLMFDVAEEGRAEPDPRNTSRIRVLGVRPRYRVHRKFPCDIVTLKHGEDTVTLRANPGGTVFVAKTVEWELDGQQRRSRIETILSPDPDAYTVDIRDAAGRPYDEAARPQKIVALLASMRAHTDATSDRYAALEKMAAELNLTVPDKPAPIARPEEPPPPDIDVLKPPNLRHRTAKGPTT